jgi:hypothetical protein
MPPNIAIGMPPMYGHLRLEFKQCPWATTLTLNLEPLHTWI